MDTRSAGLHRVETLDEKAPAWYALMDGQTLAGSHPPTARGIRGTTVQPHLARFSVFPAAELRDVAAVRQRWA